MTEQEKARLAELEAKAEKTAEETAEMEALKSKKGADGDDKKGLTMEDVQKMIQSETDKIRTDYSKKLKDKELELDKLQKEKMTDAEKAELEKKQKEEALIQKENELNKKLLDFETLSILNEKGYSKEFLTVLTADSVEARKLQLAQIELVVSEKVQAEIKKRLGQDNPDQSNMNKDKNKAGQYDFAKMSYDEKIELFNTNHDLYMKLAGY